MNYKKISIKKSKESRDLFLAHTIVNSTQEELADIALDLFDHIDEFTTKYDRANARAVVAALWWFAGYKENARLHIDQAKKELNRPDMIRDRLVFLLDMSIEFQADSFRDVFVEVANA
jgi:hypothetical protein